MQDAIGQNAVAVTPLEMALVAEAVATGGMILQPHVVDCIEDADGNVVTHGSGRRSTTRDGPRDRRHHEQFMLGVVQRGTGTAAQIPGIQVAGKTGTAETDAGEQPHAWFIALRAR